MTTPTNPMLTNTATPVTAPADPLVGKPLSTESSLSSWVGPYVTDMLAKGQAVASQPYQAYTGPLTAGPSALQNQAFSGLAGLSMQGYGDAQNMASSAGSAAGNLNYDPTQFSAGTFDNAAAQQYMNPYLMAALNPQLDEARRQSQISRLGDATRLTKAGAYGGSRQAIMESELNRNLMDKQADITGTGYRDAFDKAMAQFNAEQNRGLDVQKATEDSKQFGAKYGRDALETQLRGSEVLGRLTEMGNRGEMDYLREMLSAGTTQRGIEQQGVDADKAQFEEERNYPQRQVQYLQSLLEGLPIDARSQTYQQPSALSEFGATVGGIDRLLDLLGIGKEAPKT